MPAKNQTNLNAADEALIRGIQKRVPNLALALLGTQYTAQTLSALIQSRIDSNQKAIDAHNAWIKASADSKQVRESSAPTIAAFKQWVHSQYANDSAALGDFGLHAQKKPQKPVKVKAAAADKAVATRKSNNTMGKNQKKQAAKARDVQPEVVPTQPATAPAQPAAAPATAATVPAQPAPKATPTA
jgi:hypothetical protein